MEMAEGIWYMQMWTLNSFLETKPILRNTLNKYLGKSLLLFLLLFLVDLKAREEELQEEKIIVRCETEFLRDCVL